MQPPTPFLSTSLSSSPRMHPRSGDSVTCTCGATTSTIALQGSCKLAGLGMYGLLLNIHKSKSANSAARGPVLVMSRPRARTGVYRAGRNRRAFSGFRFFASNPGVPNPFWGAFCRQVRRLACCRLVGRSPTTTSAARRACSNHAWCASAPDIVSARAPALARHAAAGSALEAVARMSHHGRAPKERSLLLVRCPLVGVSGSQPARRSTRAQQARMLSLFSRDSKRWPTCDCLTRGRRSGVGGRRWHIAPRPCAEGERPLAGATPFVGLEHPQPARRSARAQQARMLSLLPRGSERRPACDRLTRGRRSGFGGRCWYVAPQPCTKGERPLAGAVPFVWLGTPTTSAARSRAQKPGVVRLRPRDSERTRASACLTRGRRFGTRSRSGHVASQPRAKGEMPLASAVPSCRRGWIATSAARRARAASSYAERPPQRQRAQAGLRLLDTRPLVRC